MTKGIAENLPHRDRQRAGPARRFLYRHRPHRSCHNDPVAPWGAARPAIAYFEGRRSWASDKQSDNGSRQWQAQHDVARHCYPSELRQSDPMRRHRTKLACMVRRRSTVRFRNGAPLKDQVRSSLNSSHPTLRMEAVPVLGGIWEIVFFRTDSSSGPTELAWSAREGQPGGCRTPRRGEPGVTRWSQIRRRPCRVLSEITCASQVALRAAFSQYGVIFTARWVWRIQWGAITDCRPVLSYRGFVVRGGEHGVIAIL